MMFSNEAAGSLWGDVYFDTANPLNELLEKEDVSVEDVLDEDTTIQEAKGLNENLMEFLRKESTIERMLKYLACPDLEEFKKLRDEVAPAEGAQTAHQEEVAQAALLVSDEEEQMEVRAAKFPYVACELLCCNITEVIEQLVNSVNLLNQFFGVLDTEVPLDARVSGYFSKVLEVLLRRAPEKILWFSVYRNVDISEAGRASAGDIDRIGWLMPLFLKHIGSYSITCCFKAFLLVAAEDPGFLEEEEEEEDGQQASFGQEAKKTTERIGDLDGRIDGEEETRTALLRQTRSIWLGGCGAAMAVLGNLAASEDSDAHSNAADLLTNFIHRAAVARLTLQSTEHVDGAGSSDFHLPAFSALVLVEKGSGPNAETAMIESGCEWSLRLCEELLSVALFESSAQKQKYFSQTPSTETVAEEEEAYTNFRVVERSSAAIASLQVLTHLVGAFSLDRWSEPSIHSGHISNARVLSRMISAERHATLPPELQIILSRLPDLIECLHSKRHMDLLQISEERANRVLGIHRLKIVELICALIHSRYPAVLEFVAEDVSNPLGECLNLFFHFEWNNTLHSLLERTLQFILLGGVSEESMGFENSSKGNKAPGEEEENDDDDDDDESDEDPTTMFDQGSGSDSGTGSRLTLDEDSVDTSAQKKYTKRVRQRQIEIAKEQTVANEMLRPLHVCLFSKCGLIQLLLNAYRENSSCLELTEEFWKALEDKNSQTPRGTAIRSAGGKGYMGHCHRIVNTIALVCATQSNERSQSNVDGMSQSTPSNAFPALESTENSAEWITLLQGEIAEVNAVEQCVLGGARPRSFSSPASEGLDNDMDDFGGDMILQGTSRNGQMDFSNSDFDFSGTSGFRDFSYDDDDDDDFNPFSSEDPSGDDDDFDIMASESVSTPSMFEADLISNFDQKIQLGYDDFGLEESATAPVSTAAEDDFFDPFLTTPSPVESKPPIVPVLEQELKVENEEESWEPDFGDS